MCAIITHFAGSTAITGVDNFHSQAAAECFVSESKLLELEKKRSALTAPSDIENVD